MRSPHLLPALAGALAGLLLSGLCVAVAPPSALAQPAPEPEAPEDALGPDEDVAAPDTAEDAPAEAPAEGAVEGEGEVAAEGAVEGEGEVAAEGEAAAVEEPLPEPEPAEGAGEGEIVVTGSRIKRTSFALPSAVQVMSRKDLEMSGADNMADVVRNMNINYGSELNTDVSSASAGTAQFNLRGLGLNSTLVLLNGRRLVNAATVSSDGTSFVDINTIPLSAVERIEVLKGGASAIYGSDAVAGVVNIITRKNMDGFEAQIGGQTTDDFDQSEWDVSLVGGARGEKTRANVMVSYFKREPLHAEDREFTQNGRNVSKVGYPSTFIRRLTAGDVMEGGGAYLDPTCADARLSEPMMDEVHPLELCTFNFNPYMMLVPDEQRVNTYGTLEQDIGDHTMAFFEAGYAAARSSRSLSPSFPLLAPSDPVVVPIENPFNPTGSYLRWLGRIRGGESPPSRQFFQSDTLHTVAGLKGDLGGVSESVEDWEWELAGTFSRNQFRFGLSDVLREAIQDALMCGADEDPETCWNPFNTGAPNTAANTAAVTGEFRSVGDTELGTVGAGFTGPLIELPGGELSVAVGAQFRRETARADLDHDANQLAYAFLIGGPDYDAERRIGAAYGELNLPFVDGLEVQAAARFERYDDVGSSVDPQIGLSWTPAATFAESGRVGAEPSNVRLRGTFATSFRAPSLLQMHGAQTEIAETHDAATDAGGGIVRDPESIYGAVRTIGNPDLTPETSIAMTAGLEWRPSPGLVLEFDYYRYDFDDLVVKQSHQQLIDEDFTCNVADPVGSGCNPNIYRDAQGRVLQVDAMFINAPSILTHGLDGKVHYTTDFSGAGAGTYSFEVSGTYVLSYEMKVDDFHDTLEAAGRRNFQNPARPIPRLRMTVPFGWSLDGHTAALTAHFTSGYANDEPARFVRIANADGTFTTSMAESPDIDPWLTLDLQYSYKIDEGDGMATTLKVGCTNLLDSDPPALDAGFGYDVFVHDPRGRLLYGRLIQEF